MSSNTLLSVVMFSAFMLPLLSKQTEQTTPPPPQKEYRPYYYSKEDSDIFVYGEWVRWRPFTDDNLNWVDRRTLQNQIAKDTVEDLEYRWANGYRLGLGYRFKKDVGDSWILPWQVESVFTSFRSEDKEGAQGDATLSDNTTVLFPTLPVLNPNSPAGGFFGTPPSHASSTTQFHFRTLEVKFAWPVWMHPNAILRLLAGGIFAKFTDRWNTRYLREPVFAQPFTETHTNLSWSFIGGGIEGETDIYVGLPQGFGFFADFAAALLVGNMLTKEQYRSNPTVGSLLGPNLEEISFKRRNVELEPMIRFAGGFDYKHWFANRRVMAHLALAYEIQLWFDLNQYGKVNDRTDAIPTTPTGSVIKVPFIGNFFDNEPTNMGVHGLTLRAGLDF